MIREAVAKLRHESETPLELDRRGPVILLPFFDFVHVYETEIPGLTLGLVMQDLYREGANFEPFGEEKTKLAGFLFRAGGDFRAYVDANDILPRRRFSAAHELGHAVLHRDSIEDYLQDEQIADSDEANEQREREANQFAAELLMPEELLQLRAEELRQRYKICPRMVLAYRLASELLVSREAMRYRLKSLRIGDDD